MASRGSESWRNKEWGEPCSTAKKILTWINERPGQERVSLTVDRRAEEAFRALARVLVRNDYIVDPTQTGAYNCRHIGSDPNKPWSSHAWATAVDVNWRQNPDGSRLVTDIPQHVLDEIDALHCADGTPVWRWGGDWDRDPSTDHSYYDAMHFELYATPDELEHGVIDPAEEIEMPVTAPEDVAYFQRILARNYPERPGKGPPYALKDDGVVGPRTVAAIKDWQFRRRIAITGTLNITTCCTLQSHANLAYTDRQ